MKVKDEALVYIVLNRITYTTLSDTTLERADSYSCTCVTKQCPLPSQSPHTPVVAEVEISFVVGMNKFIQPVCNINHPIILY